MVFFRRSFRFEVPSKWPWGCARATLAGSTMKLIPKGSKVVPLLVVFYDPYEANRSQPKRNYIGALGRRHTKPKPPNLGASASLKFRKSRLLSSFWFCTELRLKRSLILLIIGSLKAR